jgi:steroid delta-isomerase-like uncharacterized protein
VDETQMRALIDRHIAAEGRGDVDAAVAVYTDDVEHDVVGFSDGCHYGKDASRAFYVHLTANFRSEEWRERRRYVTRDAIVLEQDMTGTVVGSMLGLPGNGKRISFRMLHVFEFRDGLISRENVWLDSAARISASSARLEVPVLAIAL